jgi:hypothetical protein
MANGSFRSDITFQEYKNRCIGDFFSSEYFTQEGEYYTFTINNGLKPLYIKAKGDEIRFYNHFNLKEKTNTLFSDPTSNHWFEDEYELKNKLGIKYRGYCAIDVQYIFGDFTRDNIFVIKDTDDRENNENEYMLVRVKVGLELSHRQFFTENDFVIIDKTKEQREEDGMLYSKTRDIIAIIKNPFKHEREKEENE